MTALVHLGDRLVNPAHVVSVRYVGPNWPVDGLPSYVEVRLVNGDTIKVQDMDHVEVLACLNLEVTR